MQEVEAAYREAIDHFRGEFFPHVDHLGMVVVDPGIRHRVDLTGAI